MELLPSPTSKASNRRSLCPPCPRPLYPSMIPPNPQHTDCSDLDFNSGESQSPLFAYTPNFRHENCISVTKYAPHGWSARPPASCFNIRVVCWPDHNQQPTSSLSLKFPPKRITCYSLSSSLCSPSSPTPTPTAPLRSIGVHSTFNFLLLYGVHRHTGRGRLLQRLLAYLCHAMYAFDQSP